MPAKQFSNFVSGSASSTNATTLISQTPSSQPPHVRCQHLAFGRNDAGTSAIRLTLNDVCLNG